MILVNIMHVKMSTASEQCGNHGLKFEDSEGHHQMT